MFLGFVVCAQGIQADEEKVHAIQEWPSLTSVTKVQIFMDYLVFTCKTRENSIF